MHCCLSIKWVDQGVVYLFIHIQLSGLPLEPRCPDTIEVLLYVYRKIVIIHVDDYLDLPVILLLYYPIAAVEHS